MLLPVWPRPSPAVSTTFVSKVLMVTFPVHTPATNAVVVAGEIVSAPPVPLAASVAVPV